MQSVTNRLFVMSVIMLSVVMLKVVGLQETIISYISPGNTIWGSITVLLTSCLTGLDESVLQIKTKIVSSHTADSKPVKQDVNSIVILPL